MGELTHPAFTAKIFSVDEEVSVNGALYTGDEVVGVVPLVV